MNLKKKCQEVCAISLEVGAFIRRERLVFSSEHIEHKGLNDLVSYVDKMAEQQLVEALSQLLPESGFITEEETITKKGERYNWIIDPLDGTTNFIHGIPTFAISIALMDEDQLVIGVVYEINRDECFYAWKDGGAYLNDTKISVTTNSNFGQCLMATGFPYSKFERLNNYMGIVKELMKRTHGLRRIGSAAVDLAYVACGRFDGFFEYNLNSWDVAAGALIVQEAGGIVSDFRGENEYVFGKEIVASNKMIAAELRGIIEERFY